MLIYAYVSFSTFLVGFDHFNTGPSDKLSTIFLYVQCNFSPLFIQFHHINVISDTILTSVLTFLQATTDRT